MCKLDFTGADLLFGEDLSKSMTRAKGVSTITKAVFKKPQQSFQSKSTSKSKNYQQQHYDKQKKDKKADSFLWKEQKQQKRQPGKIEINY